jgi:nuclear pore complex protein Nup155
LCALVRVPQGSLQMVPTSFTRSTDPVRVLCIAGTEAGRIFLGADDGCLYEMTYGLETATGGAEMSNASRASVAEQLDQFYDSDTVVPEVITETDDDDDSNWRTLGKRAWSAWQGHDAPRPRKLAKLLNRTAPVSSLVQAIVPDFVLRRGTALVFGGPNSAAGGKIRQLVVDEPRGCLYSLSASGWICTFDLHRPEDAVCTAVVDTPRTARLYLEAVSRGQGFPPSTSSMSSIGVITFPGGGASAQAGVGGMEGARAILKQEDRQRNLQGAQTILKPVSIHVIAPTESSRLTLLAVTEGGLRFFLSSLSPHVLSNGPNAAVPGRFGNRVTRNPLAPSNRISLCHIRAPPPLNANNDPDFSADNCGVVGGITPRITPRPATLHASFYQQGVFVAAMSDEATTDTASVSSSSTVRRAPQVGDVIVATCPDSILRRTEQPLSTTKAKESNDKLEPVLTKPGGISESLSLPMSTAYGKTDPSAKLSGGIVWDFAEVSSRPRTILNLLFNSMTPSDNELSIGLPPAYFPVSKAKSQEPVALLTANGGTVPAMNGRSYEMQISALAPKASPISKTSLKLLGNVISNLLLSRPIRHGIGSDSSLHLGIPDDSVPPNYRLSNRDASKGFSGTASEVSLTSGSATASSSSSTTLAKSPVHSRTARLRPWLLHPSTVPLGHMSTHVYTHSKDLIALNAGGVHFFGFRTLLSSLAEALIRANEHVGDDVAVTSFFKGYGYKEGCSMCLALAIGCNSSSGVLISEQVRSRAVAAALARAFVPKLVLRADQQQGNVVLGGNIDGKDPLIPEGYDFKGSALCEGLFALFSRLVRPIWHKPAVVVTEGRLVKLRWSNKTVQSPAKVETIFDDVTLEEIGRLLRNLLNVMKSVFSRAIRTVPGVSQQGGHFMDVDENSDSVFLTRGLQFSNSLRLNSNGLVVPLSSHEAEHIARLIEEKNIHSLYRLLARLVQLLNLISLLRRAQNMVELREVDWGLLHGLTISQLTQCSEGQDRLESLLNTLVTTSAARHSNAPAVSAQADQLANLFADQCYLYFSPASRFAYLGLRTANEALSLPVFSSSRNTLSDQAAQYLLKAAHHWHSPSLVTGRMIRTMGKESYDEVARRAIQQGSPLARATEALMDLEDVVNIVDLCLITASNFVAPPLRGSLESSVQGTFDLNWEQNLYHKRRDNASDVTDTNLRSPAMKLSSSAVIAQGTEVTGREAIDTCYALVFYHLSSLLSSMNVELADSMVSSCAAAADSDFLKAFFSYLLESDHADTLLRIDSPALNEWLTNNNDPDLLWRYYNIQRRYREAGEVAFMKAKDRKNLPLGDRIEWFSRSSNSFQSALEDVHLGRPVVGGVADSHEKAKEVSDTLHVAQLQNRILTAVSQSKPKDLTTEQYDRLNNELIPVSELYNDFAAAFSLYEECLLIIHACRFDDVQTIQTIWKNVICEEILPCATRNEKNYGLVEAFVADVGLTDLVKFISNNEDVVRTCKVLEDGTWEKSLVNRVVSLGKIVYGTGANFVFPVNFILSNLEGSSQVY